MNKDDLLDMDYFLNKSHLFADGARIEGFYIFLAFLYLHSLGYFHSKVRRKSNFANKKIQWLMH